MARFAFEQGQAGPSRPMSAHSAPARAMSVSVEPRAIAWSWSEAARLGGTACHGDILAAAIKPESGRSKNIRLGSGQLVGSRRPDARYSVSERTLLLEVALV